MATSLIGRQPELAALTQLLAEENPVCVCGPAGIGKTSLLRAVAQRQGTGAMLIDTSDIASPEGVLAATATQLGISCGPDRAWNAILGNVVVELVRRNICLLLDGAENAAMIAQVVRRLTSINAASAETTRARVVMSSRVPIADFSNLPLKGLGDDDAATLFQAFAVRAAADVSPDAKYTVLMAAAGNPAVIEILVGTYAVVGAWQFRDGIQAALRQASPVEAIRSALDAATTLLDEDVVLAAAELATFSNAYMPVFFQHGAQSSAAARATALRCGLVQQLGNHAIVPTYLREYLDNWTEERGIRKTLWRQHALWVCERLAPVASKASTELLARQELRQAGADLVHVISRFDGQSLAARAAFLLHPLLFLRGPFEVNALELDDEVAATRPQRGKSLALALVRRATNLRDRAQPHHSIRDLEEAIAAYPGAPFHVRYRAHMRLGALNHERGNIDLGLHHMQIAAKIAEHNTPDDNHISLMADVESYHMYFAAARGDVEAAKKHALEAAQYIKRLPELVAEARQILGEVGALQFAREPLQTESLANIRSSIDFLAHIGLDALPELDGVEINEPPLEAGYKLLSSMEPQQWQFGVMLVALCCELAEARTTAAEGDEYLAEFHRSGARRRFAMLMQSGQPLEQLIATARKLWPIIVTTVREQLPAQLVIATDSSWFARSGMPRVDMSRRRLLRRLLQALIHQRLSDPAKPLSVRQLLEAAWPGEMVADQYLTNRLYVAISTIRDLGIGDQLETVDGGYRLHYGKDLQLVPAS